MILSCKNDSLDAIQNLNQHTSRQLHVQSLQ